MKRTDVKTIGVLLLAALLVTWGLAAPAAAGELKVSGQVNQMITNINDGVAEDTFIADNDNSSTRFRMKGEEDLGAVKAGILLEYESQQNPSNELVIDYDDPSDDREGFEIKRRFLDAYLDSNFGKVSLGLGSGAADNTAENDLSGTAVIIKSDAEVTAAAITFRTEDEGVMVGRTVGSTRDNMDGLSRNERIRYDTPNFAGLTLATSFSNGSEYEASVNFAAEIAGKLAASVGYVDSGDMKGDDDYTQIDGSVSWLAPFGLNLTVSYGSRSYESDSTKEDATTMYGKVGYKFGIHAVSVDYGVTNDLVAKDDISSNYSLGYVVKPWKPVELYAAYRIFMLEVDDAVYDGDIEDITQFMAGMRIKF